jgi:ABC-type sugar transport system substrate-binding protein
LRFKEQFMRRWFRFPWRTKKSTSSIGVRLRGESARAAVVIVAAWASLGCDSFSFVPPQPEELRAARDATPVAAPTRSIDLVLAARGPDEAEVWKSSARAQAGHDKVKLKVLGPAEPPATQAELVREALAHDPRVLVIESTGVEDPALPRAIEQAQSQGIPIVLVGRPLAGDKSAAGARAEPKTISIASPGHQPIISVVPQPFSVSAKQLVSAAIRNAHYSGLEPGKTAIMVVNTTGDSFVPERALAIKDALKSAGITTITEVRFAGEASNAEKLLSESLKDHPETILVFMVDSIGTSALRGVLKNDTAHRFFVAGCYGGEGQTAELTGVVPIAAVAEFAPTRMMRKALATAAALAQGRDVPSMVEFPINVSDGIATPAMVKAQALQWKNAGEAEEKAKK